MVLWGCARERRSCCGLRYNSVRRSLLAYWCVWANHRTSLPCFLTHNMYPCICYCVWIKCANLCKYFNTSPWMLAAFTITTTAVTQKVRYSKFTWLTQSHATDIRSWDTENPVCVALKAVLFLWWDALGGSKEKCGFELKALEEFLSFICVFYKLHVYGKVNCLTFV